MSIQTDIEAKLTRFFSPSFLRVENESHRHSGPAAESHFKLTVVSEQFAGKRVIARHREIYQVLQDELAAGVHALALHTYTRDEWQQRAEAAPPSPACRGGSKSTTG